MSLYELAILNNLNLIAYPLILISSLTIAGASIHSDELKKYYKPIMVTALTVLVISLMWVVFAPNNTLLRVWAKESTGKEALIFCPICED